MIAGLWKNALRNGEATGVAHFIPKGASWAMCGEGRPATYRKPIGFGGPAGCLTHKCETCRRCIAATLRRRRATKERFERILERLERKEPAVARQIAMAWPAHAREDYCAEWWSDCAPAMILDMKEALR